MDPLTLAILVISYFALAFQDNIVAWYWAAKVGPRNAKELIMGDPEYIKTQEVLLEMEAELPRIRHDMESLRTMLSAQLDRMDLGISAQSDRFRDALQPSLTSLERKMDSASSSFKDIRIPETEVDRVTRSIQTTMRRNLSTPDLLEGMSKLMDEKLSALPHNQEVDMESILLDAELQGEDGKQASYEWLLGKNLPEAYAYRIAEQGPGIIRRVAKAKGWNALEILEGAP